MAYAYIDEAQTAADLISEFGRPLVLLTEAETGPSYDPTITTTETPVLGVQSAYDADEIDGTLIQSGDRRYLVDGSVAVTTDMRVRDDGADYAIVGVQVVRPGAVVVLQKIQAR